MGQIVLWEDMWDVISGNVSERVRIEHVICLNFEIESDVTSSFALYSTYSRRHEQTLVVCLTEPESEKRGCAQAAGPQRRETEMKRTKK